MKSAAQLAVSTLALAALLGGAGSHATNLAELPLKASVLAKPNVILGMDDSGSMDSEIMLNTSDGMFWWNFDTGRGWDAVGAFYRHINLGEYWSSTWRRYFYLFPNGKGGGLNIKPEQTFGDWALPPTSEMAWSRASTYNPQYYDPTVTYKPWAKANGYVAFTDATATAARGHPIYGGALNTADLTATRSASTLTSRYFTAVYGMTLPAGASTSVCDSNIGGCGAWTAVGATDTAAPITKVTKVAMDYWPATYWIKATTAWDCTLPATGVSVAVRDCALAPDGAKLRRIEIRSTVSTYPSGRTYAQEKQNFANWFQYHRKRRLSANAAMGDTLEGLTGLSMGVVKFNVLPASTTRVQMFDLDNTSPTLNGQAVLKVLYEIDTDVGTPTRPTLNRIGYEFQQTAGPIKYACQRNAALILTDGYASAASTSPPSYTASTYGSGAPYATTYSGTLADIALSYYTLKLGDPTYPSGRVPTSAADTNDSPHMNTYALSLGAKGDVFLGETTPVPTSTGAWVNPNTDFNPSAVDDLWHATINGRGKMYVATASSETATKLYAAFTDIIGANGAQGGVAVSAVNLDRSDGKAYLGYYNPRGWTGDLEARAINTATAVISGTVTWSAATRLAAATWSTRKLFSSGYTANSGLTFNGTNFGATVNPNIATYSNQQVVDFISGNRAGEGTTFRLRNSLLGPVVNSEPVLARDERMVYMASGDGMLHAIDTTSGDELWAYLPPDQLVSIGKSVERGWVYNTLLDATPNYSRLASGTKMLVGGLGAAGRSYYGLDVSAPRPADATAAAALSKWVFPALTNTTDRNNMGYTVGKPVFARAMLGGTLTDVVLVTSGYDNGLTIGDGKGRVWVLNAATGAFIKSFRTIDGTPGGTTEAGLAHISAFRDPDGTVRYAYGGDLLGNIWRFDLQAAGTTDIVPDKVAILKDSGGVVQPVTSAPELVTISGKRVVLIGAGRILDIGDFGNASTRSFYAIADGALLANARTGVTARTYTRGANPELSGTAVDWTTGRGWYFDLPAGEQVNTDPIVAYGAVVFISNKNGASDCSQQSYQYLVNITNGTPVTSAGGSVSTLLSANATSSRVVVLRDSNGQLHGTVQLSDRTIQSTTLPLGQTIPPAKNAWKEIRR